LLQIQYKNIFEKDVARATKRGKDIAKLKEVICLLAEEKLLPVKFRDHPLIGNYKGRRECHIEPNWLLVYKKEMNIIIFERTGTHSDLFNS
jgi:mRNA interferase YafQ